MKRGAVVVTILYFAVLVILTWPILMASFYPGVDAADCFEVFRQWSYWLFLCVLLLCQAGLLLIPVKVASKRPLTKKSVYLPIIVSGFLIACLVLGIVSAVTEFVNKALPSPEAWQVGIVLICCSLIWIIWAFVFSRLAGNKDPRSVVFTQCKQLMRGSILTLLIAVPTHIVARHRDYCCAGFYTFIGITFGLAVMLLSFGPGVFFLYVERWKQLHPQRQSSDNKI